MEHMDLHETAPKHLKEAFKLYKKFTPASLESRSAAGIIDFLKIGMPGLESISEEVRAKVFGDFMLVGVDETPPKSPSNAKRHLSLLREARQRGSTHSEQSLDRSSISEIENRDPVKVPLSREQLEGSAYGSEVIPGRIR